MICIRVTMKFSGAPLKRTPVELLLDNQQLIGPTPTDRSGKVCFDISVSSGKIFIDGVERYQGRLDGEIAIELWDLTESGNNSEGAVADALNGSNAYHSMSMRKIMVDGQEVLTDSEGYLVNPGDWSEDFVRQQAKQENLELTSEHWEVIRFLRHWFADHGQQASVREMIKHFRKLWGCDKGCNHYMHKLFPNGGPQKQGNRLAGLLRTKGEH